MQAYHLPYEARALQLQWAMTHPRDQPSSKRLKQAKLEILFQFLAAHRLSERERLEASRGGSGMGVAGMLDYI